MVKKDLHEMNSKELGELFPIILHEHDKKWKDIFETEKKLISRQFNQTEIDSIEHIGSTAITNLIAKPTIDILMEVSKNIKNSKIVSCFKKIGYEYSHQTENPPPHMMFLKGYTIHGYCGQAFHVHVRYKGDWDELHFRDYLLKHEMAKNDYQTLKFTLASKFKNNREAYTNAKTEFIDRINKRARKIK